MLLAADDSVPIRLPRLSNPQTQTTDDMPQVDKSVEIVGGPQRLPVPDTTEDETEGAEESEDIASPSDLPSLPDPRSNPKDHEATRSPRRLPSPEPIEPAQPTPSTKRLPPVRSNRSERSILEPPLPPSLDSAEFRHGFAPQQPSQPMPIPMAIQEVTPSDNAAALPSDTRGFAPSERPPVEFGPYPVSLAPTTPTIIEHHQLPLQLSPMWWNAEVRGGIGVGQQTMPITVDRIVQSALVHSLQIKALLTEPRIRKATICVEEAEFDWTTFVESRFDDTSDPIGSILTTGAVDGRFIDQTWAGAFGVRQRNRVGGQLEFAQNGGNQRNNSQFLIPNPQGTTRLELNYTQPVLNGAGRFVNESRIILAELDFQATGDRTQTRIQDHLIEVTNAYWDLYLARSQLLQRRKLLESARQIFETLQSRQDVDVLQRQILRAQVAVTGREAEVIRAQTEIRNAQARLRRLVNDPHLITAMQAEWVPQDQPIEHRIDLSAAESARIALSARPEIAESMRRVRAMSVQAEVGKNELLPRLDFLVRTYVAGLEGGGDTLGSWTRQFADGRPTYGVGMLYEFPLGNRAAQGRLRRSRWELTREIHNLESTIEQTLLEVDVAVRETHTAYREMESKQRAVYSAAAEVQYLDERWRLLPSPQDSAVLLLENLLDAQQRLGNEEAAYAAAQVGYIRSWIALHRAMGTLLQMAPAPVAMFAETEEPS
ncbi:MAG: TolC family protein [Pirellulaceae bacterium]